MATNLCEKLLDKCISVSCSDPIYEGAENLAYIFNKSDIASVTYDTQDPNIVTDITMRVIEEGQGSDPDVLATGFKITTLGKSPFNGTNTTLQEGDIMNTFTELFDFAVQDNSPLAAGILNNLANGKYVVVIENNYPGSDGKGKYQILGLKKGLTVNTMERNLYDDTYNGGWHVQMQAEKTPTAALFVYKTDLETTKSYLEGLVSCE